MEGKRQRGKLGVGEDITGDCTQYLFGHARLGRFCKAQRQKEGTFARKNAKKILDRLTIDEDIVYSYYDTSEFEEL